MATTFSAKQGDTDPLQFTLTGKDGAVQDLTGITGILLNLRWKGSTTKLVTDGSCTVVSATAGTASYAWGAGETDVPGELEGDVKVTFANGKQKGFPDDPDAPFFEGAIVPAA